MGSDLSTRKKLRVMFFSAHPDDETTALGFMLKVLKNKGKVKLVLCIDPGEERFDKSHEEERDTRLKEFERIAKLLKAEYSYLGFEHYPQISYQKVLMCVKEIRDFKPDIVLMLQEDDYHTEHQLVAKIVKRAVWHAGREAFPECGKPHKTAEIWEVEGDRPMYNPNHLVDVTDVVEEKIKIFKTYDSQLKRKDLIAALLGLNRFRGVMYKKGDYAEAFRVTRFFYG